MNYDQGDIILIRFPFTDLTSSKVRPAVVVSNNKVHYSSDLIVAQITTSEITGDFAFKFTGDDLTIPLKPRRGYDSNPGGGTVYCKKIATLNNSIVQRKISKFKYERLPELINLVKSTVDIID
jgi:mRNA interferase MazF